MFAGVISRDLGEPWPATGMSSARWLTVPAQWVEIDRLVATQPGIYFDGLDASEHVGGDEFPHVIEWRGTLYLEDGHHRAVKAALTGERLLLARVLVVPDA
jgi:Arc/MetJ family transcription regulator